MRRSTLLGSLVVLASTAIACGGAGTDQNAGGAGPGGSSGTRSTSHGPGSGGGGGGPGSGGSQSTGTSTTTSTSTSTNSGGGGAGGNGSGGFTTIFTIMMENHDAADVLAPGHAPYIDQLVQQYGLATNYFDSGVHPSNPNYLYLVSGDTQYDGGGFLDCNPDWTVPPCDMPRDADHLGKQMNAAGIKWRAYADDMGTPCKLDNSGEYVARHMPFLYFSDIQGSQQLCDRTNVDFSLFAADLADGSYKYMWITPNLLQDGHDRDSSFDPNNSDDYMVEIEQQDDYLSHLVPQIQASATYQAGGVIFIIWDEGANSSGDQVPMIVISPKIKSAGYTSSTMYTHASYLATIQDLLGLPRLGDAAAADNLYEFFQ